MPTPSKYLARTPADQKFPTHAAASQGIRQHSPPADALVDQYRAACGGELALVSTLYRHPVSARTVCPGALDHTITLPDADGVTATISTQTLPCPRQPRPSSFRCATPNT